MNNCFLTIKYMSWATCYSDSNNIHFNFPPLMDDSRQFTDWRLGSVINETIKKKNNITNNWEYHDYLIKNSDNIIKQNMKSAVKNSCNYDTHYINSDMNNTPFLFTPSNIKAVPYGYSNSDLKNIYLSRDKLNSRNSTPFITVNSLNTYK